MSIIKSFGNGWFLSHNQYIKNLYESVKEDDKFKHLEYHSALFKINSPFKREYNVNNIKNSEDDSNTNEKEIQIEQNMKRKKRKISPVTITCEQVSSIRENFIKAFQSFEKGEIFVKNEEIFNDNNADARNVSRIFYEQWASFSAEESCSESNKSVVPALSNLKGGNLLDQAVINKIGDEFYVFPGNTKFFSYDLRRMSDFLTNLETPFDLVLLDPPWWNKCIRRKKRTRAISSYKMMYNQELVKLPIPKIVSKGSLIAVWCTNSPQNLEYLKNNIFPAWGVRYIAKWFWVKVTLGGEPVCPFSQPPGKQPYEQLVFGLYEGDNGNSDKDLAFWYDFRRCLLPEEGKMILSVPSAIHSHKPPLSDVLSIYLPSQPKCLELFARYLLPQWTSWGDEVLKLQHRSLFTEVNFNKQISKENN